MNLSVYISRPSGLQYGNFGDELTIPILTKLFGINVSVSPLHRADLAAVGSLLNSHCRATPRRKLFNKIMARPSPLHIWGAGFMMQETAFSWPRATIVHAVRGELSKARLRLNVPIGDPGILSSHLLPKRLEVDAKVSLVPHFVDKKHAENLPIPKNWKIVHPDADPISVISELSKSEIVVSSSLHGLIVADSLGIPAIWARSNNDLFGRSDFKFYDHASARRQAFNDPVSYLDVIGLSEVELEGLTSTPGRCVADWRNDLMRSFPFN